MFATDGLSNQTAEFDDVSRPEFEERADDSRGRHTTVGRHLFRLPAGWLLIDTPGLRELSPWAPAEAVAQVFEDIEQAAAHCRFRDCRHQGEPGCAVAAAVARGQLDGGRVENYQKLTNEATELERKRRLKIIHKAARNMPDKRATGIAGGPG